MSDSYGLKIKADSLSLTLGALQGLSLAIGATSKVSQKIYGEPVTFAGIKSAAHYLGRQLCPLPMDQEGILPDAFEQVARQRPGVTLVTIPTLQNPTNVTYSQQRREQLATIAQKYQAWIIESDIYRFLAPDAPPPIHNLAPDRTIYINSFSKCLSPDLRVGLMIAPEPLQVKIQQGLQVGGWSIPPLTGEIICQLLQNGEADRYIDRLRMETKKRQHLVEQHLGAFFPTHSPFDSPASYHMWMPCSLARAEELTNLAREQNVLLTPPRAITLDQDPKSPSGIRLCLGSEQRRQHFYFALLRLKLVLTEGQDKILGII